MRTFKHMLALRRLFPAVVLGFWLLIGPHVSNGALDVGRDLNTGFADTVAAGKWFAGVKAYIGTRNPTVSENGESACSIGMDDTANVGVKMGYVKSESMQAPVGAIKWIDKDGRTSFFVNTFAPTVDQTECYQILRENNAGAWCYVFRFNNGNALAAANQADEFGNFTFCRAMYGGSTWKPDDHMSGHKGSPPGPNDKLCHFSCHVWVCTWADWGGAATQNVLQNAHPNGGVSKIGPGSFDIWDTRGE